MAASSIDSNFQLVNYKINMMEFSLKNKVSFLESKYPDSNIDCKFSFINPGKFEHEGKNNYVVGLKMNLELLNDNESIATGAFSILGLFVCNGELSNELEKKLVKEQMPAILFPYLRASITNILASSGFGTVILPLVNIQKMAKSMNLEIDNL